jgi:DNA-binding beta-propeller fold protein YncE
VVIHTLLAFALLLSPPRTSPGKEIFVVNNSIATRNVLGRVDLDTGALTSVAPLDCNCGYGIAFGPDGRLYASDTNRLITLDRETAAIQAVGDYGESGVAISGLAFNPTTTVLYGIDISHGTLVTLSTETGRVTTIGSLNVPYPGMDGLAWNRAGTALYGIRYVDGGLYSIDPATGDASLIGAGTPNQPLDLATDPATGELWASDRVHFLDMTLDLVDPATGVRARTVDVPGVDELEGIAFPPESMGDRYCASSPNSTGGAARIQPWGSTSASAANLRLRAESVPDRAGVFFHGPSRTRRPFGNGVLCVSGNIEQGAVVIAAGNQSIYTFDASDARHSLSAFVGTTRHFQYWFRDPAAGGSRYDTSDAFSIAIEP